MSRSLRYARDLHEKGLGVEHSSVSAVLLDDLHSPVTRPKRLVDLFVDFEWATTVVPGPARPAREPPASEQPPSQPPRHSTGDDPAAVSGSRRNSKCNAKPPSAPTKRGPAPAPEVSPWFPQTALLVARPRDHFAAPAQPSPTLHATGKGSWSGALGGQQGREGARKKHGKRSPWPLKSGAPQLPFDLNRYRLDVACEAAPADCCPVSDNLG